jgi:hypothetical protein
VTSVAVASQHFKGGDSFICPWHRRLSDEPLCQNCCLWGMPVYAEIPWKDGGKFLEISVAVAIQHFRWGGGPLPPNYMSSTFKHVWWNLVLNLVLVMHLLVYSETPCAVRVAGGLLSPSFPSDSCLYHLFFLLAFCGKCLANSIAMAMWHFRVSCLQHLDISDESLCQLWCIWAMAVYAETPWADSGQNPADSLFC